MRCLYKVYNEKGSLFWAIYLTIQNACPTVKAFHRMNLNQNKCLNSNTASNMTANVAKPIKNGPKQGTGRLCMIKFLFFGMPIKTLGSLGKIRVGWVTGNTHIFFLPYLNATVSASPYKDPMKKHLQF